MPALPGIAGWHFPPRLLPSARMSDAAAPAQTPSKAQVFLRRLITTVILWTVILAGLFSSNALISDGVFLLIMVLARAGRAGGILRAGRKARPRLLQMVRAARRRAAHGRDVSEPDRPPRHVRVRPARVNDFETGFLILFVLGLCVRQFVSRSNTTGIVAIATTLFGLMYVPWLLNFIQKINFFPGVEGKYFLLYFMLVTKFSDTGAYVVGSLIGRHKMIPRISPGKTWEGFGGAILRFDGGEPGLRAFFRRPDGGHELASRRHPRRRPECHGGHRRFD